MASNIKMRVMFHSKNGQLKTYAEAIGQAFGVLVSDIPPAYPVEKERLVVIGLSLGSKPDDVVSRFCSQLTKERAANVALFVDGKPGSKAETEIVETLKSAGTNVIPETYYAKCGLFGKNIPIEKRQEIVDWVRKLEEIALSQ